MKAGEPMETEQERGVWRQSQRDSIIQPKVVPKALPWVNVPQILSTLNGLNLSAAFFDETLLGFELFYPYPRVAPKTFGATLG